MTARLLPCGLWTALAFTVACANSPPCDDVSCAPHATCVDAPAGASCQCDVGFTGDGTSCSPAPDFSKLGPDCFGEDPGAPVIANGDFFAGSNWNDPHVLRVGNQFVMYASADVDFQKNIKIYRLVSNDLVTWTLSPSFAVFEHSTGADAWDRQSAETPAVVFFKEQYYLFYTGYSDQTDFSTYRIGYATSSDGISWTRAGALVAPSNPLGAPDLSFDQFIVAEPAPVVVNGRLHVYFAAEGAHLSVSSTLLTVGLVTSDDGATWTAPQEVLVPDQAQYPRASNWLGYSCPHAVVLDGQVHLFFDVATEVPFEQTKLHHAVSADGITGWVTDSAAIVDRTQVAWASDNLNGPAVLLDGATLYLWFGGQGNVAAFPNISMGIGLLRCNLE